MDTPILEFKDEYAFLSNFHPVFLGSRFSAEHLYQASKGSPSILLAESARIAKQLGQRVILPDDWEGTKLDIMLGIQRWKFSIPRLRAGLEATGDRYLQEGNHWHDTYWGVCLGGCTKKREHTQMAYGPEQIGLNHLGKILMRVRAENRREDS